MQGELMLTVLMPTIPSRHKIFIRLYHELLRQLSYCNAYHHTLGVANILTDDTKEFLNGGPSIGKKRNDLLHRADGIYVCFLDDDESIAPDYLETLLRLCNEYRDVCCFNSLAKMQNGWSVIDMSIYNQNEQLKPGFVKRMPWHVCAIKREIAQKYEFPDSNYGEDWLWMDQVCKDLKSEAKTSSIIHQYNKKEKSEADKIVTTSRKEYDEPTNY